VRAVVVFESMFGNTEKVARAIAEGLEPFFATQIVEVGGAPAALDAEIDLLVVGAPTHTFGLSRPSTRDTAAARASGDLVSQGIGVREWLAELGRDAGRRGQVAAAAFDTRLAKPKWLTGSAARVIGRRLRRSGYRLVTPPAGFHVASSSGPLIVDEVERARRWGATIAALVASERPRVP
jgi:flavodoxin-like protein